MKIVIASHKTTLAKWHSTNPDAVLFFYTDDEQLNFVLPVTDNGPSIVLVKMHDVTPGHRNGRPLPTLEGVEMVAEAIAQRPNTILIADPRGRGLAAAAAFVALYVEANKAGRKAAESLKALTDRKPNGLFLRLYDALTNSDTFAAASTFCGIEYTPVSFRKREAQPNAGPIIEPTVELSTPAVGEAVGDEMAVEAQVVNEPKATPPTSEKATSDADTRRQRFEQRRKKTQAKTQEKKP